MENNNNLCEQCNSPMISYKENDKNYFECSYCGCTPEEISEERGDFNSEKDPLWKMW